MVSYEVGKVNGFLPENLINICIKSRVLLYIDKVGRFYYNFFSNDLY